MIHHGDCVEVMAGMEPDSIDAIVTDPPYGLEFMGKEWDRLTRNLMRPESEADKARLASYGDSYAGRRSRAPDYAAIDTNVSQAWHQRWATEALRVAKPGAYLLAFGGTRTVHRLTVALEDAGWIIRDQLCWVYASGFPKSRALLKPAWEPIVMARKPGPLRELDIDGCRIGIDASDDIHAKNPHTHSVSNGFGEERVGADYAVSGRWPANVILTDPVFDGGWDGVVGGGMQSGGGNPSTRFDDQRSGTAYGKGWAGGPSGKEPFDTTGTYSRFFLIPKASRRDREPAVPGDLEPSTVNITEGHGRGPINTSKGDGSGIRVNKARRNTHPTVKPTALMRHLIRLVTPQGGTVLDPFLGSGSTAKAATLEGVKWIGIEREAEYIAIAEQRLVGLEPEPRQMVMTA